MVGSWRLSCGNILINLLFHLDADEDADIVLEDNVNSVNGLLAKAEVQYHQGSFEHSLKFYYKYVLVNIFLQLFLIVVQTFITSSVILYVLFLEHIEPVQNLRKHYME